MKRMAAETFARQWRSWIISKKDSRIAVLLRSDADMQRKGMESFFMDLRLNCQVDRLIWEDGETIQKRLAESDPDFVLASGGLQELQEICRMRSVWEQNRERMPEYQPWGLLFFAMEPVRELHWKREFVWIRDLEGQNGWRGRAGWRAEDQIVMPKLMDPEREYWKEIQRMEKTLINLPFMSHRSREEKRELRYVWEELAEPLRLRYGVPEWKGILLAIRYLYADASGDTRPINASGEPCLIDALGVTCPKNIPGELCLTGAQGEPRLILPAALEAYAQALEEELWIPAGDTDLLSSMALEGIEMLPQQEHLSWQQIKQFYMKFMRSF